MMIKKFLIGLLVAVTIVGSFGFAFLLNPLEADAYVSVRGYYRSDGTYVRPHVRSQPNAFKFDNYSWNSNQGLYNRSYYSPTRNYSTSWYTPSYLTDSQYYTGLNLYRTQSYSYTPSYNSYNWNTRSLWGY